MEKQIMYNSFYSVKFLGSLYKKGILIALFIF